METYEKTHGKNMRAWPQLAVYRILGRVRIKFLKKRTISGINPFYVEGAENTENNGQIPLFFLFFFRGQEENLK